MLLRHAWLADVLKPPPGILESGAEGDKGAEQAPAPTSEGNYTGSSPDTADDEVARWVRDAIDWRKKGIIGKKDKPALHAAPLDARAQPAA